MCTSVWMYVYGSRFLNRPGTIYCVLLQQLRLESELTFTVTQILTSDAFKDGLAIGSTDSFPGGLLDIWANKPHSI